MNGISAKTFGKIIRGKIISLSLLSLLLRSFVVNSASAQLQLQPDREPQKVFSGPQRHLTLTWHNPTASLVTTDLHARLFQASSTTAIPLGEFPWKQLSVLPGQTVLESATVDFPVVRAETRFLLRWVTPTNQILGTTDVLVYPTNLLRELKILAGEEPPGLLDPENHLKPLLKTLAMDFADLEENGVGDRRGKLVVAGPFRNRKQMREDLPTQIQELARKGVGIVWIQPPPERNAQRPENIKSSFYTITEGKGAVVVVQPELVARLAEDPQAQLNLLHFARLALHPEPLSLPHLSP